jgi:hydrogenase maturation protein HypF
MEYIRITIKGIVQGVGFRPFLFNLAKNTGLNGVIINKGNIGVEILSQDEDKIEVFIEKVKLNKPKISYIEDITVDRINQDEINIINFDLEKISQELKILPSEKGVGSGLTLPPDIAMCDECIKEMNNPELKRFSNYPFIACAQCGPRFTTVKELPYDRERTTMEEFPYCHIVPWEKESGSCINEYKNFEDRRFHAQTFACSRCGPNFFFLINDNLVNKNDFNTIFDNLEYNKYKSKNFKIDSISNEEISSSAWESINLAINMIKQNKIIAVMGIGGVHLVCRADNQKVVETLRKRKRDRKYKPFAIMVNDIQIAKKIAKISEEEENLLISFRRPIVLVEKSKKYDLPEEISPGLNNIGIMLPYTGIHHLLFKELDNIPLIYTSGNISGMPMAISPNDVISQLGTLADGYLLHNREIYQRCDDSVVRYHSHGSKLIRRSRGFVPEYIPIPFETKVKGLIALGPEINSTGCVGNGYRLFPTQHVGVNSVETLEFLKDSIIHLKNLLRIPDDEIEIIIHDSHPLYYSNKLIQEFIDDYDPENRRILTFPIPHHTAHAASLMIDCNIQQNESAIVVTLDGVGYGTDGNVWGGEIIYGVYHDFKRGPHQNYIPMIGGDQCVKYPSRMLFGFLLKLYDIEEAVQIFKDLDKVSHLKYGDAELNVMKLSYQNNENYALSSSCGRFLDAISSLLDICHEKTYRGEPAMRLEGFANGGNKNRFNFYDIVINDLKSIDNDSIIRFELIIDDIIRSLDRFKEEKPNINEINTYKKDIAASLLNSIGRVYAEISYEIAKMNKIYAIGLSGGVSYNKILSESFYNHLEKILNSKNELKLIKMLYHNKIPPGDAGISIGQAVIAISMFNQKE